MSKILKRGHNSVGSLLEFEWFWKLRLCSFVWQLWLAVLAYIIHPWSCTFSKQFTFWEKRHENISTCGFYFFGTFLIERKKRQCWIFIISFHHYRPCSYIVAPNSVRLDCSGQTTNNGTWEVFLNNTLVGSFQVAARQSGDDFEQHLKVRIPATDRVYNRDEGNTASRFPFAENFREHSNGC